jgi:hypothetical protein
MRFRDGIGRDVIFSRFFRIFWDSKYCFLLSILQISSTMMCCGAHLMFFDRYPESLNEYQHCGHLLLLTLLCGMTESDRTECDRKGQMCKSGI